jgi:cardiolipin synthase
MSWLHWVSAHTASVITTVLVIPFLARILRDKRPQGSTLAWLLAVIAIPYVGIPLYLLIGSRKQLRAHKRIYADKEESARSIEPDVARLLCADGIRVPKEGNDATLLETGEIAFAKLMECIREAKSSIRISTFILADDATGRAVTDALTERARAGVKVHLLIDGFFAFRASRRRLADLRAAGAHVAVFAPIVHMPFRSSGNLRNHRKSAVFDGASAIVGGMNIAEEYMGATPLATRWCDLCALVRGPAVADIADVFCSDWEFATNETLGQVTSAGGGSSRIQIVPSGPDSAADSFYEAILSLCYAARERVWIVTPYFVPDDALTRALCAAAHRGLDVRVIVPLRSNHRVADLAGGGSLRQVEAAGGRILTFPRMIHAKVVVVDETIGVVGSANFDMRSLFLDYELCLFLYTNADITELARWFENTAHACGSLPKASRTRALAEDVGRLFSPLV